MSEEGKFKVVTTNGTLVNKGSDKHEGGLGREVADNDCARRNLKAEALGINVRYEVVPFGSQA